ncbi:MAG: hypothetical protein KME26_25325 [Oscillatoria princeps RMCB-10]|jgi:hypothetical protein|nr:hypothetical protein [Oscillatoria princeps RMCB-10]MBW4496337.1 hypothetical protein [Oscillatoria princeps RMCB-10]
MTAQTSVDSAMERILAIKWEPDDSRASSHIALLREYLRRAALWAKALNCTDEWPFFDVAAHICPLQRAGDAKVEALGRHFSEAPFYATGIIEKTCEWFLHWDAVKNRPEVTKFALPDPYEPLIIMYERGGIFSTEHGFFNFEVGGFPRGTWSDHYQLSPAIELDVRALEELDSKPL